MDESKDCRLCGKSVPADAKHCIYCGGRFPAEGPTQKLDLRDPRAYPDAHSSPWSPNMSMAALTWYARTTIGASGLYGAEGIMLVPDEYSILREKKVLIGTRTWKAGDHI